MEERSDLLAFADRLGEPGEAAWEPVAPVRADDAPMSAEQAAYLGHLLRRLGRAPQALVLTFSEAKRRIAELLDELS